jgi:ABC-type uncharacterized transport system permease subunit
MTTAPTADRYGLAARRAADLYGVRSAARWVPSEDAGLRPLLMLPASSQFLVGVRAVSLPGATRALTGLALTAYAGTDAGVQWSLVRVAEAAGFELCGFLIFYAIRFATATCSFWLQADLNEVVSPVYDALRYPVPFYGRAAQTLLTYCVPVAFAATFPTQALLGHVKHRLLPLGVVFAVASLVVAGRLWGAGVREYGSAAN